MTVRLLIASLLISTLSLAGCAYYSYTKPPAIKLSQEKKKLFTSSLKAYPQQFKAMHRIILSVRNKEYDFLCIFVTKGSDMLRIIGFGEMGGKIFDLIKTQKGVSIVQKPFLMPSGLLVNGLASDLAHIYQSFPGDNAKLAFGRRNGEHVSYFEVRPEVLVERSFSASGDTYLSSMEAIKGKIVRKAKYSGHRQFPGWHKKIPATITLHNKKWDYTLNIELLKIDSSPVPDTLFLAK